MAEGEHKRWPALRKREKRKKLSKTEKPLFIRFQQRENLGEKQKKEKEIIPLYLFFFAWILRSDHHIHLEAKPLLSLGTAKFHTWCYNIIYNYYNII